MFSFVPNELQIYFLKKRFLLDFLGFVRMVPDCFTVNGNVVSHRAWEAHVC